MNRIFACIALSMMPLAASARSQTEMETGSNIPIPKRARIPDDVKGDANRGRIVAAEFARCTIARNPNGVARAIDLPPVSAGNALAALATSECLDSGQITIPRRLMRGAIFVELYRVRAAKKVDIAVPRPLDLSNAILPEFQQDRMQYALLYLGDCVIKRDVQDARDVVLLPTASKAQDASFKKLIPNLGPCLMQGQKVAFSKPIIEGVLAEVLYRGTVEPAPVAENK